MLLKRFKRGCYRFRFFRRAVNIVKGDAVEVFQIFKFVTSINPDCFCRFFTDAEHIQPVFPQFQRKAVVVGIRRYDTYRIDTFIGVCKFNSVHNDRIIGRIRAVTELLNRTDGNFFKPCFPTVHIRSCPIAV